MLLFFYIYIVFLFFLFFKSEPAVANDLIGLTRKDWELSEEDLNIVESANAGQLPRKKVFSPTFVFLLCSIYFDIRFIHPTSYFYFYLKFFSIPSRVIFYSILLNFISYCLLIFHQFFSFFFVSCSILFSSLEEILSIVDIFETAI